MVEPPLTPAQLRIRALTGLATAGLVATLALVDWEDRSGRPNVFTGLKPALRDAVAWVLSPEQRDEDPGPRRQR